DTFKLYVDSLDPLSSSSNSNNKPTSPIDIPSKDNSDFDVFDTSYVDPIISGVDCNFNAQSDSTNVANCDQLNESNFAAQTLFQLVDVEGIDSNLNSPENVGSFNRPEFFKFNSFMIWNDPDQQKISQSFDTTNLNSSSPPISNNITDSSPDSKNMKTMKKRGLFSRSTNGGTSLQATSELDVSHSDKSSKSPTTPNGQRSGSIHEEKFKDEEFNGDGVQFQGKLIGHEYVADARGEDMCQQSLKKLKIIQKAVGGHKRRIHMYISFDGIKIHDAVTLEQLFHHTVPQISFISRDESDTRAFGYVFGNSATGHQFIGIKTKKEAMHIMQCIGQLFASTLKRKQRAEEAAALAASATSSSSPGRPDSVVNIINDTIQDDHMYHSVYEVDPNTNPTVTNTSRSRRSRTISNNSENVPIPALPPPLSDHQRRAHQQINSNIPQTVKSQQQQQQSNLFNETDMFASFDPNPQPTLLAPNQNSKLPSSSYEWANFDDDNHNNRSISGNNQSIIDDSTLNTISSITDMNVQQSLSNSRTLSQNDQTSASATLVARSNQKNHLHNGSSSTIASTNFDGADPFSDAFGSDDPFSGSMAVGGGSTDQISGSFALSNLKSDLNSNSVPTLANQLDSIGLNKSAESFKSNLELANSFSKQSVDSTSSADKYAALADVNNLCSSIFDELNQSAKSLNKNVPSVTTTQPQPQPLPSNGSFGNQGNSSFATNFSTNQPIPPNMYGASSQSNPMYHPSMMPVYVSNVGHSSVSPNMMAPATMMNSMATSSQMYQQQTGMPSSSPLIHSSQWSAGSTSSLPNSFADHHHQPQYHMTGNHSTVMTAPYNSNTINSGANLSNGMMHRNNTAKSSSGSLFATPPIAAHSFSSTSTESSPSNQLNQATSNGSINRSSSEIPLFQDLDPLSKNKSAPFTEQKSNKIPESKFPLQQQSFDSFSRNCSTPSSITQVNLSFHRRSPFSGQHSLPCSSVGTSSPEPSLPPPSPLQQKSKSITETNYGTNFVQTQPLTTTVVSDCQVTVSSTISRCISSQQQQINVSEDDTNPHKKSIEQSNILNNEERSENNNLSNDISKKDVNASTATLTTTTTTTSSSFSSMSRIDNDSKLASNFKELSTEHVDSLDQCDQLLKNDDDDASTSSSEENGQHMENDSTNELYCNNNSHTKSDVANMSTELISNDNEQRIHGNLKSTISRQSSTTSSTREQTSTPPAIPPRTDLQYSGQKYRYSGPTPPPLPPLNTKSSSNYAQQQQQQSQQQFPTQTYPFPPSYGTYGPYVPPTEMYTSNEAATRRYRFAGPPAPAPPPPPPLPAVPVWNASSGHYEYLYPHPPPPLPPEHHSPYYHSSPQAHHFQAPPPPPLPPFDPYYRQSPYSAPIYQTPPYSTSPAPPTVPPTSSGGWNSDYYQQPPPPIPISSQFAHLPYKKSTSSICSTTPPAHPPESTSPISSSDVQPVPTPPPLPNPQRRISSSSMVERYNTNVGYNASSLGRSNSAIVDSTSSSSSRTPLNQSTSNPSVPSYHHSIVRPPPPYYPSNSGNFYQHDMNPYEYAGSSSGETSFEHFYDVPRRKESDYMVPMPSNSFISFNANMEQMMMKYHQPGDGSSPMVPDQQGTPTYGPGPPSPAYYHNNSQTMSKRFPNILPSTSNGCNSSNSSSGSSGYSTMSRGYYGNYQPQRLSYGIQPNRETIPEPIEHSNITTIVDSEHKMKTSSNSKSVNDGTTPFANLFDDNFSDTTLTLMPAKNEVAWSANEVKPNLSESVDSKVENNSNVSATITTTTTIDNNNNDDNEATVNDSNVTSNNQVQQHNNDEDNLKKIVPGVENNLSQEHNIFVEKDDPFDDDFFKQ
ncbi:Dab2p, partial [Blomia tropicalis]